MKLTAVGEAPRPDDYRGLVSALRAVLAVRERELLDCKGPCTSSGCVLHYAHSGPCNKKDVR